MPIFMSLPIKHRIVISEPLLGYIDFCGLADNRIEKFVVGGESGDEARVCDFEWVKGIRDFCVNNKISFSFKQTGARFRKDGKIYSIPRKYQFEQAKKSKLDVMF